jgi:peptidoglycan glycosyltransferase
MHHTIPAVAFQRIAAFFIVCFLLIGVGAGYWSVVAADSLAAQDFPRQIVREQAVDRGRILSADGSVLVQTRFDENGNAVREYAYPALAPVTGHWTLVLGRTGLEGRFDDYLSGRAGQQGIHAFDEIMHEQVVGADLVTTINPTLQAQADALLGNQTGAVVVMNPRTGDVLAMASHPYYDPNTYADTAEQLVVDPAQPTLNRATRGLYTPGSIFKVVTLAGVLDEGKATLDEQFSNDDGVEVYGGFPVRDFSDEAQRRSPYDLRIALAWSSNVTFAALGQRLGPDGMRDISKRFGLTEEIPFDITTEPSQIGTDAFLLEEAGLVSTAFGQGQLFVTPLQMALVASGIANDGVIMTPRLVSEIRSREGDVVQRFEPRPWRQAISNGVAADVREAMIVSATEGYARAGAPAGITIGGKTGSAQLGGNSEPHAWFMAFAPAENPEIVVIVLVERGGLGGDVAAPIARELIGTALSQ